MQRAVLGEKHDAALVLRSKANEAGKSVQEAKMAIGEAVLFLQTMMNDGEIDDILQAEKKLALVTLATQTEILGAKECEKKARHAEALASEWNTL